MNVKILDGFCIFADSKEEEGPFYISTERDCVLCINGAPLEAGAKKSVFRISPTDLAEGENTVAIKIEGVKLPCQRLYRHGALVKPISFPTERVILALLERIDEMQLRLQGLERSEARLSARFLGPSLFDI